MGPSPLGRDRVRRGLLPARARAIAAIDETDRVMREEFAELHGNHRTTDPRDHAVPARLVDSVWPREESNLRTQIRSLPLYPLSYGACGTGYRR